MMTDSLKGHGTNRIIDQLFAETTPERVVPIVVYLASRACELTHHNISAVAGRFARVAVALGPSWLADRADDPTAEDIADHLKDIAATEPATIPTSVADEIVTVLGQLGII